MFVFVLGRLVRVSSSDWIGVWFGLEINLFRVVPFFSGVGLSKELEAVAKYFVVQAVGSVILLLGSLLGFFIFGFIFVEFVSFSRVCCVLVRLGLMVKIGLVPFHFWVPRVMGGLRWLGCLILSVWQKIVPLFVLISFVEDKITGVLVIVGCLGSVVGGLGGFLQTQLRVLLGYSSIRHRGWLVAGGIYRFSRVVFYFVVYSLIAVILFYMLYVVELDSYLRLAKGFRLLDVKFLGVLALLLVTLAGLPPTAGFAMKWSIIINVLPESPLVLAFLVGGSLLRLYYYLCVRFSWCVLSFSVVWNSLRLRHEKVRFFVALISSLVMGYVLFLGAGLVCG